MKLFCGQDMVSPIKKILIKHPQNAHINQSNIKKESAGLNYGIVPDYKKACSDYNSFLELIKTFDIEVHSLPVCQNTTLDSIYNHDSCFVSGEGIILCNMGKRDRVHEPHAVKEYFKSINIPILGQIENPGKVKMTACFS